MKRITLLIALSTLVMFSKSYSGCADWVMVTSIENVTFGTGADNFMSIRASGKKGNGFNVNGGAISAYYAIYVNSSTFGSTTFNNATAAILTAASTGSTLYFRLASHATTQFRVVEFVFGKSAVGLDCAAYTGGDF